MGSAAKVLPLAVAQILRDRRKELRLTLQQVSDTLAEQGQRIPTSTLNRIEQGKLDPGVRRLYQLLDLYHIPPHLISDLVELENLAVRPSDLGMKDLETLHREGIERWKAGDIPGALAYLFAVRQYVPDTDGARHLRQQATLAFATAARGLGKFRLARQLVDDLLCEPPEPSLALRVFVLASALWRGLGSADAALAFLRQAETYREQAEPKEIAWVFHQKAKLLLESGQLAEAERELARALKRYRALRDRYGEIRALVLRAELLEKQEDLVGALRTARRALGLSQRHAFDRGIAYANVHLGRLLVLTGKAAAGIEALNLGLGKVAALRDRNGEFFAQYQIWKAHQFLGDSERATFALRACGYFLQSIDERTPETEEVRRQIQAKKGGRK